MHRLAVAIVLLFSSVASVNAAPQITNVIPENGPTAGGSIVTIYGTGFAAAGNFVAVGGSPCTVTAETPDQLECTLPEGSGASRPIRVIGGGQASPPYPFSYEGPAITAITAASVPTAGGTIITITGQNFGAAGSDRRVTVNGSAAGSSCGIDIASHTKITCTLPPGEGHDVAVEVEVDGQTASAPGRLSYDPPAITAVTPTRGSAAGGVRLTINGANFGVASSVTVGGSSCSDVLQSHTQLECTSPPTSGAPPAVRVTAGGQASNDFPFSSQLLASKCDAAKWKAATSYAQCLGGTQAKGAKKALTPDAAAVAKCDEKLAASCAKAESNFDDCSQLGTCAAIQTAGRSWDGTIKGRIQ
jgi:hypothetical protein